MNSLETYKSISCYDKIFVRDSASKVEAKKFNIDCSVIPDLSFYQNIKEMVKRYDIKKPNLLSKKLLPKFIKKYPILVGDSVLKNISLALKKYSKKNHLMDFDIFYDDKNLNLEKHLFQLTTCKFVITGRYHTVCMCINLGIPFFAIESNTNKISALLTDCFNSQKRLIDIVKLDFKSLTNSFEFTQGELDNIKKYKEKVAMRFSQLKETISE